MSLQMKKGTYMAEGTYRDIIILLNGICKTSIINNSEICLKNPPGNRVFGANKIL